MAPSNEHRATKLWTLARRQHGVLSRAQLFELGYGHEAIRHRVAKGRLHPIHRGVYAVGWPELTRMGEWMAAVLACGGIAFLSHGTSGRNRRDRLEAAINAADRLDLIDPETLRASLGHLPRRPGLAALRRTLDRHTFHLTDSELERRLLALIRKAGLPMPVTQQSVNGYRVDFYWPELGLVGETDGLRYHRTPAQQVVDNRRDQAHAAVGLERLRFPRAQIRYEPDHVIEMLELVISRLSAERKRGLASRR